MILAVLSVSAICFSATAKDKLVPGSQVTRDVKVKSGGKEVNMRYWQFVPKGYNGKKNLPLMHFLHGAGARGERVVARPSARPDRLRGPRGRAPLRPLRGIRAVEAGHPAPDPRLGAARALRRAIGAALAPPRAMPGRKLPSMVAKA